MRGRILVIDDEPAMLENCQRLLSGEGAEVEALGDPRMLRPAMAAFEPDVLLVDLRMPAADGMVVLGEALAIDALLPVIIMTGFGTVASAVAAIREGAFDFITKPFSADQLSVTVDRALRYRLLAAENRALRSQVGEEWAASAQIAGKSAAIERVMAMVRQAAPTQAAVLIEGESGTGKELFARLVHDLSPRRKGPFVPIDCASLPEGLLESELFGHERGAFTGAVARKRGLLADASNGTVFLDEVGEMAPGIQVKLLRVLEARQVRPVGGTQLVPIDVRIVAATNLDLEHAVREGRFRSDLFFRLNVVHITLPPLRSRSGDVPVLLDHFLRQTSVDSGRAVPCVSPEALDAIEGHTWPGNVRELRNLAQRLVVMDTDSRITLSDLPAAIRGWPARPEESAEAPAPYRTARDEAMREFLRQYAARLLDHHGGNVTQAAKAAGVTRRAVYKWLAGSPDRNRSGGATESALSRQRMLRRTERPGGNERFT